MLKPDYSKLAKYYDFLQQEIDYNVWIDFLNANIKQLKKSNSKIKILEIGCGTGKLATMLDLKTIDYTGYDLSPDMIEIAKKRNLNAKFLVDDATIFELNEKFDIVICFMDTINYLTTSEQVESTFKQINNHLKDGGRFLFDIHQEDNIENFDDYQEIGYIDDVKYIWHSKQISQHHVNHFFTFIDEDGQIDERHEQMIESKAYYQQKLEKYFKILTTISDDYREYFIVIKGE